MKMTDIQFDEQFHHAGVLRDEGHFSDASKVLKALLGERPEENKLRLVLGHVYWEQKSFGDAIECFRKATVLDPLMELASLGLYHTLWSSGLREKALEEMKRFIQISHSDEYDALLQAFRECKDDDEDVADNPPPRGAEGGSGSESSNR